MKTFENIGSKMLKPVITTTLDWQLSELLVSQIKVRNYIYTLTCTKCRQQVTSVCTITKGTQTSNQFQISLSILPATAFSVKTKSMFKNVSVSSWFLKNCADNRKTGNDVLKTTVNSGKLMPFLDKGILASTELFYEWRLVWYRNTAAR